MNLSMLGRRDALKVGNVVVKRVFILVMYLATIRDRSVMMLPNGNVKRDFLAIAVLSPTPKVPATVFLLSVAVVLSPIEDDRLRVLAALVHSASDWFC